MKWSFDLQPKATRDFHWDKWVLEIDCVPCLFKQGGSGAVELRGKNYSYFPTGSCCIIVFTLCNVMESDVTLRFLHLKARGTERMPESRDKASEFSMVNKFEKTVTKKSSLGIQSMRNTWQLKGGGSNPALAFWLFEATTLHSTWIKSVSRFDDTTCNGLQCTLPKLPSTDEVRFKEPL